jgi:hypothetical protein
MCHEYVGESEKSKRDVIVSFKKERPIKIYYDDKQGGMFHG